MVKTDYFLTKTREENAPFHWTDWFCYAYLFFGALLVVIPIMWVGLSSFKTDQELSNPTSFFIERVHGTVDIEEFGEPLHLYKVLEGGLKGKTVAEVTRKGSISSVVLPANPEQRFQIDYRLREPVMVLSLATENYTQLFQEFDFLRHLTNSVIVLLASTALMLAANTLAAYALARLRFKGKTIVFWIVVATLLVPQSTVLVPLYYVSHEFGMLNNLWGLILPSAAIPAGIFLLRQYMLSIPEDIIEAARMDKASEWQIFWRIVLPICKPGLAIMAILSIFWNWNNFLWPLISMTDRDMFTLPIALYELQSMEGAGWGNVLAMSILMIIPMVIIFAFLLRYVSSDMAVAGGK